MKKDAHFASSWGEEASKGYHNFLRFLWSRKNDEIVTDRLGLVVVVLGQMNNFTPLPQNNMVINNMAKIMFWILPFLFAKCFNKSKFVEYRRRD